ncbi:unnamed protein product [Lactuca saligna]|uniref:Uncharacterized protein n=1 Tax=Lactuca saligna TaxID=75948 RepID=A0AA35ZFX8_LACSI|nr:unnamed protein product [Lactuca saligna]
MGQKSRLSSWAKKPNRKPNSFGVSLGTGKTVSGQGRCQGILLQVQGSGLGIKEDFLPLTLESCDVILGIQWLEKLEAITTNWKTQLMKFQVNASPTLPASPPYLTKVLGRKYQNKLLETIDGRGSKTSLHSFNKAGSNGMVNLKLTLRKLNLKTVIHGI